MALRGHRPRVYGGGPKPLRQKDPTPASSPCVRGWTATPGPDRRRVPDRPRVYGGGPRGAGWRASQRDIVPVCTGGGPVGLTAFVKAWTSSPCTRGKPVTKGASLAASGHRLRFRGVESEREKSLRLRKRSRTQLTAQNLTDQGAARGSCNGNKLSSSLSDRPRSHAPSACTRSAARWSE